MDVSDRPPRYPVRVGRHGKRAVVQLAFDAYHFGADPAASRCCPEFAGRIAIVHLADGCPPTDQEQNRTRLGQGAVPLPEVSPLSGDRLRRDYDVELIGQEIEATDYRQFWPIA